MTTLQLVPVAGTGPLEISADQTMVGRDPKGDVVINDGSVSRRHVLIERRGPVWVVMDQGSANGTWIDDARVVEAPLRNGQNLRLGAVSFSVVLPDEQPVRTAALPPRPVPARPAYPVSAGVNATRNIPPRPAPPQPPPPPPAAPAAGNRMSTEEAAALLGLWAGAPAEEVRRQYQRIYNDLQIRLTNAPAPSLKRMYQKNLQDLKIACEVLCPGLLQ